MGYANALCMLATLSGRLWQGYDATQGYDHIYDESAYDPTHGQGYAQDHTVEGHYQRGGGGGAYAKKRLIPSEPSPHVIFLGLDPDFTEADVSAALLPHFEAFMFGPPASSVPEQQQL